VVGLLVLGAAYVAWVLQGEGESAGPDPLPFAAVVLIPETLRADFGMDVEMLGGRPGPDAVIRLTEGDAVKFRIKVERDTYVGIWTVEADGTVLQLFPNDRDRQHFFRAEQERVVPEAATAQAVLSRGLDRIWIQASTEPWDPAEGQRAGPFMLFKTRREQEAVARRLRGIRLRSEGGLADRVLPYRVGPRQAGGGRP
jgi:hypothetical protein